MNAQKLLQATKELAGKERFYTAAMLKNLCEIEKHKLYSDLKYPTLFKYLVKELGYSESEANARVGAVGLMMKASDTVEEKIKTGKMSLSSARATNDILERAKREKKKVDIEMVLELVSDKSVRETEKILREELKFAPPKKEMVTLDEHMLAKMERARKILGDHSNYELIDIMLEKLLREPAQPASPRHTVLPGHKRSVSTTTKISRYIPVGVKAKVYSGKCSKCGEKRNLEYDHAFPFAWGGTNNSQNIRVLCRNCNRRQAIRSFGPSARWRRP